MNYSKGWQFATRQIVQLLCALALLSLLLFVTSGRTMDVSSGKQVNIPAEQIINDVEIPLIPQLPVKVTPIKPGLSLLSETSQVGGKVNTFSSSD